MITVAFNNRGADHLPEAAPYKAAGLPGWIRAAHDWGFRAFQFDHYGGGGPDPSYFAQLDVDAIRTTLEDCGVTLSLHHHDFDFCSLPHFAARDDYARRFLDYLRNAVEFIAEVNGHTVTFHPPQLNHAKDDGTIFTDKALCERAIEGFREMVLELGDFAANKNVRVAMEAICFGDPLPGGTAFRSQDQFDEFFRSADFPDSVGLLVDTSHFRYPGMSLLGAIRQWSDRLYDIHADDVTDFVWVDRETYLAKIFHDVHLPIGHGILDFAAIVQTLKDVGYDGWLTLELYPQNVRSLADHTQSRERLEEWVRE